MIYKILAILLDLICLLAFYVTAANMLIVPIMDVFNNQHIGFSLVAALCLLKFGIPTINYDRNQYLLSTEIEQGKIILNMAITKCLYRFGYLTIIFALMYIGKM